MSKREIYVNGQIIEVSEEVYSIFMQDEWREKKRKYRMWRCRDEKGNRCKKDCSQCPFAQMGEKPQGSTLSLDLLMEEGFDVADPTADVEVAVAQNILKEAFAEARSQLLEREQRIMDLVLQGYDDFELAEKLNLSYDTARKARLRMFGKLKKLLADYGNF